MELDQNSLLSRWLWTRALRRNGLQELWREEHQLLRQKLEGKSGRPADFQSLLKLQTRLERMREEQVAGPSDAWEEAVADTYGALEELVNEIRGELKCATQQLEKGMIERSQSGGSPAEEIWEKLREALQGNGGACWEAAELIENHGEELSQGQLESACQFLFSALLRSAEAHAPGAGRSYVQLYQRLGQSEIQWGGLREKRHLARLSVASGEPEWTGQYLEEGRRVNGEGAEWEYMKGLFAYTDGQWEVAESCFNQALQHEREPYWRLQIRDQLLRLYFERFHQMDHKLIPAQLKHLRQYLGRKRDLSEEIKRRYMLKSRAYEALFRLKRKNSPKIQQKYRDRLIALISRHPYLANWDWLSRQLSALDLIPPLASPQGTLPATFLAAAPTKMPPSHPKSSPSMALPPDTGP